MSRFTTGRNASGAPERQKQRGLQRSSCRAGLEYYRENFSDTGRGVATRRGERRILVPLLTVDASAGVRGLLYDRLRLRAHDIRGVILECGHYAPEERPLELAKALLSFWSRWSKRPA
ncbi:hypothetical protein [Lacisediminihabitans profunda]|uniref:Alpha/beta hydrolase n=1 Tax=Lacisediminihabitans profunda TaxID=2594790 RepID=A0A5C8UKP6_9MICO|nr:hypothetical protein [Lacisediminihabitans profunda]TXN28354.1 hypothetical protein FVP33_17970 [Lacisediminihabitans profunda]